jgi:GTPase Era involved in 16S rRNA processing
MSSVLSGVGAPAGKTNHPAERPGRSGIRRRRIIPVSTGQPYSTDGGGEVPIMSDTAMKLDTIAAALSKVHFNENIDGSDKALKNLRHAEMLLSTKLRFECNSSGRSPLIITVSGGANSGKSSLVSWLCGGINNIVSSISGATKTPLVAGDHDAVNAFTARLERGKMSVSQVMDAEESKNENNEWVILSHPVKSFSEKDCVMIDTPDFDSRYLTNHERAEWMWALSDVVIFVVTPEKYNDRAVERAIHQVRNSGRKIIAVFNKYEEEITKNDFISKTWNCNEPILDVNRFPYGSQPDVNGLRTQISRYYQPRDVCKRSAVEATLKEFRDSARHVALHLRNESAWLKDVRTELDKHSEKVFDAYSQDIYQTEKFLELDHIIKRMLEQYDTVIDDVYNKIGDVVSPFFDKAQNLIGWAPKDKSLESDERREREKARFTTVLDQLEQYIINDMIKTSPGQVQPLITKWVEEWRHKTQKPEIDTWIYYSERKVNEWVDEQVAIIDQKIKAGKYNETFLKYGKAAIQVSFGVLGGYLTGGLGFGLQDVVIVPAVERLFNFLIDQGMNRGYFVMKRKELIQKRHDWLKDYLQQYIDSVMVNHGEDGNELSRRIEHLIHNELPSLKEIC